MPRRQAIEVIEERYTYPKRRQRTRRRVVSRYPVIDCMDLRCSREDHALMRAQARKAKLSFEDWAATVLVRAVRRSRRRSRYSL